jgi:hypothetical protein
MRTHHLVTVLLVAGALVFGVSPSQAQEKKAKPVVYPAKAQSMRIDGQVQFRYTFVQGDSDQDIEALSQFQWRRVRLNVSGDLNDWIYYQLRNEWADAPSDDDGGSISLNTTYIGFHMGQAGNLRLGRFTTNGFYRPSSKRMAFSERALHVTRNNPGSQRGMYYDSGDLFEGRLYFEAGMFNGNGDTQVADNTAFLYMGRVAASTAADFPYDNDTDLTHSDWALAAYAGAWGNTAGNDRDGDKADIRTYGGALAVKGQGLWVAGSYSIRKSDSDKGSANFIAKGWDVTGTYSFPIPAKMFIVPKVRYERYQDETRNNPGKDRYEGDVAYTTVGANLYLAKYNCFLGADYIIKQERGDQDDLDNNTFIVQANLLF